jgi:myo-inositol-1(or 4)-monophosphatase
MDLLELSKNTVMLGLRKLSMLDKKNTKGFKFSTSVPREIKADADLIIEKLLIDELSVSGLNILSEERGFVRSKNGSDLRFIIDPIDGTVNFVRNIAECSISVALFDGNNPIFGVIGSYPSLDIAWGGKEMGSFIGGIPIGVSSISDVNLGILCTGYPSRFDFNSDIVLKHQNLIKSFNKIRMLGSASQSLLKVAKGSVEAYCENNIMIWDVAAGLAIVEGAGGEYIINSLIDLNQPLDVAACNNSINKSMLIYQ